MSKKIAALLFMLVLVSQTVLSGISPALAAGQIGQALLTDVDLTDEKGNMIDSDVNSDYKADPDALVNVNYYWSLQDLEINNGDTFTFNVPQQLKVVSEQHGKLTTTSGVEVGNFRAGTDGSLTISLNENATSDPGSTGKFSIKAAFNSNAVQDNETLSVPFDLSNKKKTINVSFQDDSTSEKATQQDETPSNDTSIENTDAKTEKEVEETAENSPEGAETAEETDTTEEAEIDEEAETSEEEADIDEEVETNEEEAEVDEEAENNEEAEETRVQTLGAVEIQENIITNFELTLRDGSPLPDPMPNPNEEELELKAKYSFALPNDHEYGAGSTYTFELPEQLAVYNQIEGDLDEYGTYHVSEDGTVTFSFNENIEKHSDIEGWVEVYTVIDKHLEGEPGQVIIVPIRGGATKEITINIEPKVANSIDKRGTPDQKYNATNITWEIDFNKNLTNLNNAVLHDPIEDSNQKFVNGSIKIYKLNVQLDGSVTKGDEVTSEYGDSFPIDFGNINKEAYRVVFETEIIDGDGTNYPNKAIIKWDDGELSAEASVAVSRGKALEKRSVDYDPATQTITWEVKYNYNEKLIVKDKAILTDVFAQNQELIHDSFVVQEITINSETGGEDGSTIVDPSAYTVTDTDDGFKFQFNDDITKAYKIQYKTTATDRVTESGIIGNTITDEFGNEGKGSQYVDQGILVKSNDPKKTSYDSKQTGWEVEFNKDSYVMKNVVVEDKLPKGFTPKNVEVVYDGELDYTYDSDESTGIMKFVFNEDISKPVKITFLTDIDYNKTEPKKESYLNTATVFWVDEEGTDRTKEGRASFIPNNETVLNGSKSGSYNAITKEITWTVGVNYNNRQIAEAIVEDLIQGNQNLDLDSIEVYKMIINSNGTWDKGDKLTKDSDYKFEEITKDDQPGFRINLGTIDTAYVVEFTTSLEGEKIVKQYENEAVLIDGETTFPLHASVSINNGGNYTGKDALQSKENEELINWTIKINYTQSTISNAVLSDTPSNNQVIMKDSFVLYGTNVEKNGKVSKDEQNILAEGTDYTLEFKEDKDGNAYFQLSFKNEIDRPYILEYDTYALAGHGETVNNEAMLKGENITSENTGSQKEVVVRYSGGDGGASGKVGKLEITKVDAATGKPLQDVEFTLFDKTGTIPLFTALTDEDGKITFDKLRFGDYILKETKVPDGYVSEYEEGRVVAINKDVKEDNEGNKVTIENAPVIYAVELTKVDKENAEKLAGAIFELQQKENGEYKTIKDSLKTDDKGKLYVEDLQPGEYQFVETAAPNGYLLNQEAIPFVIKDQATEVVKVTAENKAIETTSIAGEKKWIDGDGKNRPAKIKVDLLQDGEIIDTKEVTAEKDWHYSFKNLPKTDSLGKEYVYTVKEQNIKGYKSTVDGYDITNLRVGKTEVTGTKTWKDDNSKDRPQSITIELLQNGEVVDSKEVTGENGWQYSFTDLEKYDENGVAYKYSVKEVPIEGYQSTVDGNDIINLRVGKTEVNGTKIWKDDNSKERPQSITVQLLQNGKVVDSKEVTAENGWKYSFTDLEKYDKNGAAYEYTVKELPVEGYQSTVDGYDITNVRVGETDVEGTKSWQDDKSKDRPKMIKVNLLQNGVVIDTKEVTADDNWKYSFNGLDKYDEEGKPYKYTVKEQGIPGYKSEVDGFDIVNTRSEQTSVEITKGWKDDDSEDRPDSVTVNLLQNGTVIETVEVTASEDWTYEFDNLEAYDEKGVAYEYTIEEVPVEGYQSTVDGYDITNVRVGETAVEGTKIWDDNNFKNRPDMIKVDLLQNGVVIDTQEVTSEQDWTYSFTELDQYDENGKAYSYEVREHAVDGYEFSVSNYDITNKLILGSVELTKVDPDNPELALEGAEFELRDAEGNVVKEGLITSANGKIIITDLQPGDYQFVETKAPEGYELNPTPVSFTIELGEQDVVKVIAENNKETIEGKPKDEEPKEPAPKKPGDSGKGGTKGDTLPDTATSIFNYALLGIILLVAGLAFAMRRTKKE